MVESADSVYLHMPEQVILHNHRCEEFQTSKTYECDVMWVSSTLSSLISNKQVKWCEVKWREVKWREVTWSEVKWSDVMWSDVKWIGVVYVKWFCFETEWVTVKFLGIKVPGTLGWPYTEGNWLYCDYFIWCVSCTVDVLTGFVMCGCVCVCVCVWIL
jgi:hypothetical protein